MSDHRFIRPRLGGPIVTGVLFVIMGVFCVYPVAMLFVGAFSSARPGLPSTFTLDNVERAYSNPATVGTLSNSVVFAASTTLIGTTIGFLFAWISARTNTPGRRLLTTMMVITLAMPSLFYAISWGILGNERAGILNVFFRHVTGIDSSPIDVYSWPGLVLVQSVKGVAFAYILLIGPMSAMNRSIEDAASIAGAGKMKTLLTVTAPVLAPSILGVLVLEFVLGIESFDIPLLIGLPAGVSVFSTQIYNYLNNAIPADYGAASALGILVVLMVVALVIVQWRVLRGRSFVTVSGKTHSQERWDLGRWKYIWTLTIVFFATWALALPLLQLVLGSLQPFFGLNSTLNFNNYTSALNDPSIVASIGRTMLMAVVGGFIATLVSLVIAYIVRHSRRRFTRILELATWLPWAVPGVVLGLAMLWAYLSIPALKVLYGSSTIVLVGLTVAALPIAARSTQSSVQQLGPELEESARTCGASPVRTILDVVVPLTTPSFLAAWFLTGLFIAGKLDVAILLSSPNSRPVAVVVYGLFNGGQAAKAAAVFCLLLLVSAAAVFLGWLALRVGVAMIGRVASRREAREIEEVVAAAQQASSTSPTFDPMDRDMTNA